MSKGRRESEVLAGVLAYLSIRGDCDCWRNNVSAGIARSGQYMQSGKSGASDVICIQAPMGRFVGIELKREIGGSLSAAQEEWGSNLEAFGGLYLVARDVETVARGLGPENVRVMKVRREKKYPRE